MNPTMYGASPRRSVPPTPVPASSGAVAPPAPTYYVPLPLRLLRDLCDSPLAIGVFALIARRFRVNPVPVPLSAGDVRVVDPTLSYGAATRALQRLVNAGYLIAEGAPGCKRRYTPAWGYVGAAPRPFDTAATGLGRPRHLTLVRLDQRLLDSAIGRLDPHAVHTAQVHRFTTMPLLSLSDIGSYACALGGYTVPPSPALERLNLLDDAGRPQPLADEQTLLAWISQQAAGDPTAPALTAAGWARTAFNAAPQPADAGPTPAALFFVPPDRIGSVIGPMIGNPITCAPADDHRRSASECANPPIAQAAGRSHGSDRTDRSESTTPTEQAGGGVMIPSERSPEHDDKGTRGQGDKGTRGRGDRAAEELRDREPADAANEVVRVLKALGVRGDVARTLADRPPAQVARVIAQAQARPGVRDRAAWVVSTLRALPPEDAPPAPPPPVSLTPILHHPTLTPQERMVWLRRFRSADPADRPAVLARFHAAHPQEPTHDACA